MSTVNKAVAPYHDDYDSSKNYHEILFVPRRPVQVRELNQIQSMFYNQVKRFGDHIFEDGSMVIAGEINHDLNLNYVQVDIDDYVNVVGFMGENIKLVAGNGTDAKSKLFSPIQNGEPATFYVEYGSSGTTETANDTSLFEEGQVLQVINELTDDVITTATVTGVGVGSKFTIASGVYYLNGRFVLVESETVLLDKYSNTPSKIVCLEYNEVIVNSDQDDTLLDNALGSPNYSGAGADRLRVDTRLRVFNLDQLESLPDNVYEIFRIRDGEVQLRYQDSQYSQITNVLAQRTFEQAGDYTVKSFDVGFREHSAISETPDSDKYAIQLDKGVAYVRGYRVENLSKVSIESNKARSTEVINNAAISASLGHYILVNFTSTSPLPNIGTLQQGIFRNALDIATGKARVRFIRRESGNTYRLYLFNITDLNDVPATGFLANATTFESTEGEGFECEIVEGTNLMRGADNSLLYPLNVPYVKTLLDSNGDSDTSYTTIKRYTGTLDTNGRITFNAGGNELFVAQDSTYAIGRFSDGQEIDIAGNITLGGTPIGRAVTLDVGSDNSGRGVTVYLQIVKQEVLQKTKTTQTVSVSGSMTNGRLSLGKADAFEIVSIFDDQGNNVTEGFTLNRNKTRSFYGVSFLTQRTGYTAVFPITVQFKYFEHSTGDFFSADSYVDVDFNDIPVEEGVKLSDVLDFRPRIADNGQTFTGTGSVVGNIPAPFTVIRADFEHYLGRKDRVYVASNGEFGVIEGVPSLEPKLPAAPADSMVLYNLTLEPYTANISRDIRAEKVKNRRYTMRDIGNLEQRIANVEYYVSLSQLELEADSRNIMNDETGTARFKNGFLTDQFIDHSVGDFVWTNYHVSMSNEGELRPEFSLNAVDYQINENDSQDVTVLDDIVMLPYTSVSYVRQNQRSELMNVNPYAVFRWGGELRLSPWIDSWIDPVYTLPEVVYQVFNNGNLTQTWNSWELNWVGGETTETSTQTIRNQQEIPVPDLEERAFFPWEERNWRLREPQIITSDVEVTTSTTTRTNIEITDDRVIDRSVIPFMRSIEIRIDGMGNRPNTRMYFFFDDVDVTGYVRPNGSNNYGDAVITNADGEFTAHFLIPNDNNMRFRVGEKQFVATDNKQNNRQLSTSFAETTFTSTGIREIRRQTIVATRNVTTSVTSRITNQRTTWVDPLAQSFLVERTGGVFITSINVFFAQKDPRVPVTVQIREMENGFPTQRIVPAGSKTLNPRDVGVSDDGSVATNFEFDHPVYLTDGNEYCFVIMSNSNNYYAHIARMGDVDVGTGQPIVEQPYAGVLFKSQNNSTWTADQVADLQFEIFMAQFDTETEGTLILENKDLVKIRLGRNPFSTTANSSRVLVNRPRHNYIVGGKLEISGATGGNGINSALLNTTHTITEVLSPNQVAIELSSNATITGVVGGESVVVSDTIQATLLRPNIPAVNFIGTAMDFEIRGTIGQSIDGNETAYSRINQFLPFANNANNELTVPWVFANRTDEAELMNNNRSSQIRIRMRTNNPNVSPIVDLQGLNVITPCNLITGKDDVVTNASNNYANYRTRPSSLRLPANSLRVFLDVRKPDSAEFVMLARFANSQEELNDANWIQLDTVSNDAAGDGFYETEFDYNGGDNEFTVYQVMIQLKTKNAARPPICKRLRAIATYG